MSIDQHKNYPSLFSLSTFYLRFESGTPISRVPLLLTTLVNPVRQVVKYALTNKPVYLVSTTTSSNPIVVHVENATPTIFSIRQLKNATNVGRTADYAIQALHV